MILSLHAVINDGIMIPFAAYTAADFQWAGLLPKIAPYCGGVASIYSAWFLGPPS